MAMDGTVLGAALKSALTTSPNPGESMDAYRTRLFDAMGAAIVAHIQSFAQVNSSVVVNSVTGVTSGGSVSGPGDGTATGTIL